MAEIGYSPVMSEFGDIGYIPTLSVEDSCYVAVRHCHLAILIIAKRYGAVSGDGLSVTHKEFRAARRAGIPVLSLVDKDVLAYKAVYDANVANRGVSCFPGMEHPGKTFALIDEITSSEVNNGIQAYLNVADARTHVKRQLAHFMGDLLQSAALGLAPDIKDVIAELKTLRHELVKPASETAIPFLRTMRRLLSSKNSTLADLLKVTHEELDLAVPAVLAEPTLVQCLQALGCKVRIVKQIDKGENPDTWFEQSNAVYAAAFVDESLLHSPPGELYVSRSKEVVMNEVAKRILEAQYTDARGASQARKTRRS